MKVTTGKVESGRIVVEGESLAEGAIVTVLAPEDGEVFELSAGDEAALLASVEEAERGDVIDGDVFLRELGNRE